MIDSEIIDSATRFFPGSFGGVIRIEVLDAAYAFWVDGRQDPPIVSADAPRQLATDFCLWRIDYPDLMRVCAEGTRRIESSFVAGRLKISGDMAVMARLETAHD